MKTIKTLSSRIAALLLVVTVGITALPPAAVSMAAVPAAREARAGLGLPVEAVSAVWAAASAAWAAAAATAAELAAAAAAATAAELAAAAAALVAWAAAAATAAEPDADADIMTKGKPHLTVGLPFCLFVI